MAEVLNRGAAQRRAPRFLTLLFDETCPLCRTLKSFLAGRKPIVPIELVAVGSPAAIAKFPLLDQVRAREILTVIDDSGLVYEADAAWLMCGWAIPGLRSTAEHLSTPLRRKVFRHSVAVVNRVRLLGRDPYPSNDVPLNAANDSCETEACPVGFPASFAARDTSA
jgi:predicted DCC family thiol-disulfide oxidoreductase YuxK